MVHAASKTAAHSCSALAQLTQQRAQHKSAAATATAADAVDAQAAQHQKQPWVAAEEGARTGQAHGHERRGPRLRNEQQAAYQQKRAARRGEDGDDASESDDELPEFDAEAAEAMRAAPRNTGEKTQKKKSTTEGLIKTANPNAPQKQHLKMSQLDGSGAEARADAARARGIRSTEARRGLRQEARRGPDRRGEGGFGETRAAKARREAAEAARSKETEEEARQKALAKAQIEMMQGAQTLDKVGTELAGAGQGVVF